MIVTVLHRAKSILLLPLLLGGCVTTAANPPAPTLIAATPSQVATTGCPSSPPEAAGKNVQLITLEEMPSNISGMANSSQSTAYQFEGKAEQKFSYEKNDEFCIWVFTPDVKPLKGSELPTTGRYSMQIAAKQGSKTFNLQMSLGDREHDFTAPGSVSSPVTNTVSEAAAATGASSTQSSAQIFVRSDFPKTICGDSLPSDFSTYPVKFYPVTVPNTEENLNLAQSRFCADSYRPKDNDSIQVASFSTPDRAEAFATLVRAEISGASVGSPKLIYK